MTGEKSRVPGCLLFEILRGHRVGRTGRRLDIGAQRLAQPPRRLALSCAPPASRPVGAPSAAPRCVSAVCPGACVPRCQSHGAVDELPGVTLSSGTGQSALGREWDPLDLWCPAVWCPVDTEALLTVPIPGIPPGACQELA